MLNVIVVDDDQTVSLFINRLLTKRFMCKVKVAENGLKALELMKEDIPDVIFLDITMPIMDGIETLEAIRSDEKLKHMAVIMLTAVSDPSVVNRIGNLGVFAYMRKPLTYDATYERIKELFDRIKKDIEEKKRMRQAQLVETDPEATNSISKEDTRAKILIVEKDDDFRAKFKSNIEKTHNVLEASTGAEGLKLFMKQRPKIICLGNNIPIINEKLLAQKIRVIDSKNEVIIFALKSESSISDEEKALYDLIVDRDKEYSSLFNNIAL